MQMSTSNKIHNALYQLRVTYLEVVYTILLECKLIHIMINTHTHVNYSLFSTIWQI